MMSAAHSRSGLNFSWPYPIAKGQQGSRESIARHIGRYTARLARGKGARFRLSGRLLYSLSQR